MLALSVSFLIPVLILPSALFYYDITPKAVVIFLAAAIGLIFISYRFDSLRKFAGTPLGRWYSIVTGASIAASLLAAWQSVNPLLAWNGSNWRRFGAFAECATIIAALLISAFISRNRSHMRALLRAICVAGILTSLYGIAQYFRWDPFLTPGVYEAGEGPFQIVRPPSTMGHADYFAAFSLWPVFAGIGLALEERARAWRVLAIFALATGILAIVLSGSRGAMLALVVGGCICCSALRPRLRAAIPAAAVAAAILVVFYISPAGQRLRARVHWMGEDRTGGARLLLWRDSVTMAATKPMTGFGPDNFVAEFPRFQSVDLERAYPDFMHESPHNVFLDSLVSEGTLGLLALLAVSTIGIIAGIKAIRLSNPANAALLAAFTATLLAHQFIAFTASTAFYFYLGAGLLVGMYAPNARDVADKRRVRNPPTDLAPNWRWLAIAPALLFTVLAFQQTAADRKLIQINRRLNAGDARGAAEAYRSALKDTSTGLSADLYFSRRWATTATNFTDVPSRLYYSQIALGAATLATRFPEQRQNAWYNVATLAAARGDSAAVETALRSAITAGPNWYKPHWALARLLSAQGRLNEAVPEASLALQLNPADSEIAATFAALSVPNNSDRGSKHLDGSAYLHTRE